MKDKVHTEPKGLAPTYTLGLHLFLTTLLRNEQVPIKQNVLHVSLALIRIERDGEIISRQLLKTLTDMLCELREISNEGRQGEGESIYKSWWEEHFLDETRRYYANEAETNLERCSGPDFLARVERRLQEESDRIDTYLHASTHPFLFSLLDQVLISNSIQSIISHPTSGLAYLLADDKVADLSRMYKLFGRTGEGHIYLTRAVKAWVIEQGAKIAATVRSSSLASKSASTVDVPALPEEEEENFPSGASAGKVLNKGKGKARDVDTAPPKAATAAAANSVAIEWVTNTLALKDKMDTLWTDAFEKDRQFQNAINDVGERIIVLAKAVGLGLTDYYGTGFCHFCQRGQEGT